MRTDIKDYSTDCGNGFRIGDVVMTGLGIGQIIGYDENHKLSLLVQIDGHECFNGTASLKYGEHGTKRDCMWFRPERLTLIKSTKENENGKTI